MYQLFSPTTLLLALRQNPAPDNADAPAEPDELHLSLFLMPDEPTKSFAKIGSCETLGEYVR